MAEQSCADFGWNLFQAVGQATSAVGKWTSNAVDTAGKEIGQAGKTVGDTVSSLAKVVPQVGKDFSNAFDAVGKAASDVLKDTENVVNSIHIDPGVLSTLKSLGKIVQQAVPYIQMVVSNVPGLGTAVSAALGAGLALAEGQPIQDVLMDGVKGALPGQPLSSAAFSMVQDGVDAAIEHKDFDLKTISTDAVGVAGSALDLPPAATNAMKSAINIAAGALQKKTTPQAVKQADAQLKQATASLPKAVQDAIATSMAMNLAKHAQNITKPSIIGALNKAMNVGQQVINSDAVVKALYAKAPPGSQRGFQVGIGAMQYKINNNQLMTIRGALNANDAKGFDMAVSLHIGRVIAPIPAHTEPAAIAANSMVHGMQGASIAQKVGMMTQVASDPIARVGAVSAVKTIANNRMNPIQRVKSALGMYKPAVPVVT